MTQVRSEATSHDTGDDQVKSTRRRIQQVALELFARHGFDGTSLQRIADKLGVTKAALYYHFPSKQSLLSSLVADLFGDLDVLLEQVEAMRPGPARQRALLAGYLDLLLAHRRVVVLLVQDLTALTDSPVGPGIIEYTRRLRQTLAGDDVSTAGRVRAAAAIGAVHEGVLAASEDEQAEVRSLLLRSAYAVLGIRAATTATTVVKV